VSWPGDEGIRRRSAASAAVIGGKVLDASALAALVSERLCALAWFATAKTTGHLSATKREVSCDPPERRPAPNDSGERKGITPLYAQPHTEGVRQELLVLLTVVAPTDEEPG
jgi:hypothetical protein